MASYEELRSLVLALVRGETQLLSVRTEEGFTDILFKERSRLSGALVTEVRLFKNDHTQQDLLNLIDDLSVLGNQIGVAISPSGAGELQEIPPNLLLRDYEFIIKRADDAGIIESPDRLVPRDDFLEQREADLLKTYHPLSLAKHLESLCRGEVPEALSATTGTPWDSFEDLTALVLTSGLHLNVRREGHTKPFEHVPEGYFLTGDQDDAVALYDCKGTEREVFTMDKNDELRFKSYIQGRKTEIRTLEHAGIRFFVVFACGFGGNVAQRMREILGATGVHLCLIPVGPFADFCRELLERALSFPEIVRLVKWSSLLAWDVVEPEQFGRELDRIDQAAKRY